MFWSFEYEKKIVLHLNIYCTRAPNPKTKLLITVDDRGYTISNFILSYGSKSIIKN